ncbi:hypothetical protein [Rhodococcus indonesiensis]|uniref:hypothetical protein n=1 Tax=Rhodococcus indonesiensis TaxID=3055869 RepID=UPI0039F6ED79
MSDAVVFDSYCGEPIAWLRVGDPVIGYEWTEHGNKAITERLSPADAVRRYGPITEVELGRNGGFKSATYGATKFFARSLDPRGTRLDDDALVVVIDSVRENHECPVCNAAPGAQCVSKKGKPCATHNPRSHGRSRWEIEQAREADRLARQQARAAEQWEREMATPPVIGSVIEIKRWTPPEPPSWERRPDTPERVTVQRTYANRTIDGIAESGERRFLARNEATGDWHVICGQPTSPRLPCKNGGTGLPCRTRHKAGVHLREDAPWLAAPTQ